MSIHQQVHGIRQKMILVYNPHLFNTFYDKKFNIRSNHFFLVILPKYISFLIINVSFFASFHETSLSESLSFPYFE